jgi:hypothetical protein
VLRDLSAWCAVIQKLPGRCHLALRHQSLPPRHTPELAGSFQAGTGTLNGQIPFHLGQTGHDVKEKPSRWRPGIDGVGQAFELNVPSLQAATGDYLWRRSAKLKQGKCRPQRPFAGA